MVNPNRKLSVFNKLPAGKYLAHIGSVHVAVNAFHFFDFLKLGDDIRRAEISGMDNKINMLKILKHLFRQCLRMGISDYAYFPQGLPFLIPNITPILRYTAYRIN